MVPKGSKGSLPTTSSSEAQIQQALDNQGLKATPSARVMLESLRVSPEFLAKSIREKFPEIDEITTKIATEVTTQIPQWMMESGLDAARRIPIEIPSDVPSRFYKTMEALSFYHRATAKQISIRTRRAQSTERSYLNALFKGKWIQKQKVGRRAFFYIESEEK